LEDVMPSQPKLLALAAILAIAFGTRYSSGQNPTLATAMREKLIHAQSLLGALVTTDFATINRSANALGRISETEILSWEVGAQPEYRKQAMLFVHAVQRLREVAHNRDMDAAGAAYTDLVSSCTRCHTHVRKSRLVRFESTFLR
jgi:hypothetical protein